jgi:hypothetical protein
MIRAGTRVRFRYEGYARVGRVIGVPPYQADHYEIAYGAAPDPQRQEAIAVVHRDEVDAW